MKPIRLVSTIMYAFSWVVNYNSYNKNEGIDTYNKKVDTF
jgi:hypothetical protein